MLNRKPLGKKMDMTFPKLFGGELYNRKFAFGKDYYCAKQFFGANLYLDGREEYIGTIWDDTDIVHIEAIQALTS